MATTSETRPAPVIGFPASLAGFEDEARFSLMLDGARLGTVQVAWKVDGRFECKSAISFAGQTMETSVSIVPDEAGRWSTVTCRLAAGTLTVTRQGTAATRHFKDRISTLETPEGCLIYDNEAPLLISQALRLYDRAAGGEQKFPLLFGLKIPVELKLAATETELRRVGAEVLALTRYRYSVPGMDIFVWADDRARIYVLETPSQAGAVMVREGYEALRKPEDAASSEPLYEVEVQRNVPVPMRDGLHLATDIYSPQGLECAPVILVRSPYKKEISELQARFFARRGYVFAVQDCRGCHGSPGVWEPLVQEGPDGYDTIEWLAGQPYSNGKVGMIGASYLGWIQWSAAAQNPPHLVTLIPNVSPPDPFYNIPYEYGVFHLLGSLWWLEAVESGAATDISGAALEQLTSRISPEKLRALPVVDLDRALLGREDACWRKWIAHSTEDDYWRQAGFSDKLERANIPVFHQSGWFDADGIGAKLNYLKMSGHGHAFQKLTLGPWGHTDTATRTCRNRDFGESAILDLQRDYLRWFDHWLNGLENGIDQEPLVSLFVMGANQWARGDTYPLENTRFQKVYLSSRGAANTSNGDGRLSFDPPGAACPPDRYTYDPGDPTPDFMIYQECDSDRSRTRPAGERDRESELQHQRISERRRDVLVYQTGPLSEPLTFAGPLSAIIYASTSGRDTDWFVTLSEVDTQGNVFQLVQGKIRARFKNSMSSPELLTPGEICRYAIDLWHTGISIPAGGRLRVEIASASFPRFSRNLNTGGHNETETEFVAAEQAIFHDEMHPSHVLLPLLDGTGSLV